MEPGLPGLSGFEEVGRGGFGIVYGAFDARFGRRVAVKIIRDSGLGRDVRARFERECLAIGSVSGHPNIVAVYDSGVTDGGDLFLVMEFLGGGSARQRLREQGPATPLQAVRVGIGLAGALETAHRAGIVHRDIKPENILYSDYDVPKLVDFGIARVQFGYQTRTGLLSATLNHAAPEVVGGSSPGSAVADVYSLASVLYTLLAGQPPFYGGAEDSLVPLISRIVTQPAPDIAVTAGVPEHLARVIARGLAKDPAQRFPSAADFGAALQEVNERLGGSPLPLPLTAAVAAVPPGSGGVAGAAAGADPGAATRTHGGGDPESGDEVDEADQVTHVSPVEALDEATEVQRRATTLPAAATPADPPTLIGARTAEGGNSPDAEADDPAGLPTGGEGRPARHRVVAAAAAAVVLIVTGVVFGLSRIGAGSAAGAAAPAVATGVNPDAASVDQAPGPSPATSSSVISTTSAAPVTSSGTVGAPPTVDPQPAGGQQQVGPRQGTPQGQQQGQQPGSAVPAQPPPPANRPPTVSLSDRSNDELVAVSFAVGVNDPDGDAVSVTVAGLPPGVAAAGASVNGTISQAASSTTTDRRNGLGTSSFTVTVTAIDSKGARTSGQFLWTVRDTHRLMPDYIGQYGCAGCGGLPDVAAVTVPGFYCAYDPSGSGDRIFRQSIAPGAVIRWGQAATYWYGKNDPTCQRVAKGW